MILRLLLSYELYLRLVRNLGFGYQCPGQNDCILWRFAIPNSFDGEFLEFVANLIEFLTPLKYRQCAGRAGRRGFDLLGNVIFYGLPIERVQRIILSKLPSLGGTFPLTSTLTLRLFNLLDGSQNADYAVKAVKSLMSLPHISFYSDIGRSQLLHHLRFSIEYLRRSCLLDKSGQPMNLFALAAHLYVSRLFFRHKFTSEMISSILSLAILLLLRLCGLASSMLSVTNQILKLRRKSTCLSCAISLGDDIFPRPLLKKIILRCCGLSILLWSFSLRYLRLFERS